MADVATDVGAKTQVATTQSDLQKTINDLEIDAWRLKCRAA